MQRSKVKVLDFHNLLVYPLSRTIVLDQTPPLHICKKWEARPKWTFDHLGFLRTIFFP